MIPEGVGSMASRSKAPAPGVSERKTPLPLGEGFGVRASCAAPHSLRAAHLALRDFARGSRAAAGIELAIGAVALITVAALIFDLYSRVDADTAGTRIAAVMADYVSRGPDAPGARLDGEALKALGKFLYERELGVPANLVYVISTMQRRGPAVKVRWFDDSIRFGAPTATAELASDCSRYVEPNGRRYTEKLPASFKRKMADGEILVLVEVCARLTREGSLTGRFVTGNIYRHHALPARTPEHGLRAPVYAHGRGSVAAEEVLAFHAAQGRAESGPRPPSATALVPRVVGVAAPSETTWLSLPTRRA